MEVFEGLLFGLIVAQGGVEVVDLVEGGIGIGFGWQDASQTGEPFRGAFESNGYLGERLGVRPWTTTKFILTDCCAGKFSGIGKISLCHVQRFALGDHGVNPFKVICVSHC